MSSSHLARPESTSHLNSMHAILYSADFAHRAMFIAAGSLHRQIVDAVVRKYQKGGGNMLRVMTGEITELRKDGWISASDAQRLKRMVRILYMSKDGDQMRAGFRTIFEELKADSKCSLLALGVASVAVDSVDRCPSDTPPSVMMKVAQADGAGAMIGMTTAYGMHGGGEGGGVPADAINDIALGAVVGAGVASGLAAVK